MCNLTCDRNNKTKTIFSLPLTFTAIAADCTTFWHSGKPDVIWHVQWWQIFCLNIAVGLNLDGNMVMMVCCLHSFSGWKKKKPDMTLRVPIQSHEATSPPWWWPCLIKAARFRWWMMVVSAATQSCVVFLVNLATNVKHLPCSTAQPSAVYDTRTVLELFILSKACSSGERS